MCNLMVCRFLAKHILSHAELILFRTVVCSEQRVICKVQLLPVWLSSDEPSARNSLNVIFSTSCGVGWISLNLLAGQSQAVTQLNGQIDSRSVFSY